MSSQHFPYSAMRTFPISLRLVVMFCRYTFSILSELKVVSSLFLQGYFSKKNAALKKKLIILNPLVSTPLESLRNCNAFFSVYRSEGLSVGGSGSPV